MTLRANSIPAANEQLSDDQSLPYECVPIHPFLFRPKFAEQRQQNESLAAAPAGMALHLNSSNNEAGMFPNMKAADTTSDDGMQIVVGTNTSEMVTVSVAV